MPTSTSVRPLMLICMTPHTSGCLLSRAATFTVSSSLIPAKYPENYWDISLQLFRRRWADPTYNYAVAVEKSTGKVVGNTCWFVMGDHELAEELLLENGRRSWFTPIAKKMHRAEQVYKRYLRDWAADWSAVDRFVVETTGLYARYRSISIARRSRYIRIISGEASASC
ncbi:hypothetical protein MRB53_039621 [Persea americana]|nr:hypothetical protein MRB53_039621 [Persea americana]